MSSLNVIATQEDRAKTAAIAVWVKTPGYTPAKTRLAKSIGAAAAEEFYRLAVNTVRETIDDACHLAEGILAPYWAVTEGDVAAQECWLDFPVIAQGVGGLGQRLAHVYDVLQPRHQSVIFIGVDSPQLSAKTLMNAAMLSASPNGPEFTLGPAVDGGFYLFGGRAPIPRAMWTGVTYSASSTMAELVAALAPLGRIELLDTTFDVDTVDDLRLLRDEFTGKKGGGAARSALHAWLRSTVHP